MSTDFARLMDPDLREHFVYRAFDAAGRLLYVGCTMNLDRRHQEHKYGSQWYAAMTSVKLSGPYNYTTARRLEKEAINTEGPLQNGQEPGNMAARRARSKTFARVMNAALEQGMDLNAAAAAARIAVDSEVSA